MEAMKAFLTGHIVLFLIILVVLPPLGVILFGLFFVPILLIVGFAEVVWFIKTIFTRERYVHG
jgi:hypothetical protein